MAKYILCLTCEESREVTLCEDCNLWLREHINHKLIFDDTITWLDRWKIDKEAIRTLELEKVK